LFKQIFVTNSEFGKRMKYLHAAAIIWCCLYLTRQGIDAGTTTQVQQPTTAANGPTTTPSSGGGGSSPTPGPPMIMFPSPGSMPQWKLVAILVPCVVGGITLLALCCCCCCMEGGWCVGCCHMTSAPAAQAPAASPYTASASNGNDFYGGRVYQQPVASGGGAYGVYRV